MKAHSSEPEVCNSHNKAVFIWSLAFVMDVSRYESDKVFFVTLQVSSNFTCLKLADAVYITTRLNTVSQKVIHYLEMFFFTVLAIIFCIPFATLLYLILPLH